MSLQKKTSNGAMLMKGNGALMNACCCPASCSPYVGNIRISGYTDNTFTACAFAPYGAPRTVWDGVLIYSPGGCYDTGSNCVWKSTNPSGPGPDPFVRINNNAPGVGLQRQIVAIVRFDAANVRWELLIQDDNYSTGLNYFLCFYTKTSGAGPDGLYSLHAMDITACFRNSLCGTGAFPATVTITL